MIEVRTLSNGEFDQACGFLDQYKPRDQLKVVDGILRIKPRNSVRLPFYKPENERIDHVAKFAFDFFCLHIVYLQDKLEFLQKFQPFFEKAKCSEKFEQLINRVEEVKSISMALLVPDTVSLILSHLTGRDLARVKQVSRIFRDVIQNTPSLSRRIIQVKLIKDAIAVAKEMKSKFESNDALLKILDVQLKFDFENASSTIKEFRILDPLNVEWAYAKLAREQVRRKDFSGAFTTLGNLSGIRYEVTLGNIAIKQAKYNLVEAFATARKLKKDSFNTLDTCRAKAFAKLIYDQSKENSPIAEALKIKNPLECSQAIANILAETTEVLPEDRTRVGMNIISLHEHKVLRLEYKNIHGFTELAKTDIKGALVRARAIQTNSLHPISLDKRDEAFTIIAIEQANHDLGGAFTMINEIEQNSYRQTASLQIIANHFNRISSSNLKALINKCNITIRPYLLAALATQQSKIDRNLSYRTFLDAFDDAEFLLKDIKAKIYSVYAQVDLDSAIAKAKLLSPPFLRVLVLIEIAKSLRVSLDV